MRAANGFCVLNVASAIPLKCLGFFVGVADLSGQPQRRVVVFERCAVLTSSPMEIGDTAERDHLLGYVSDFLRDQPRFLIVDQRLIEAFRGLVDLADRVEHLRFVRQIAQVTVDGQGSAVRGETLS